MLICPVCKAEYQEGYKICNECRCDLVESPEVVEDDTSYQRGVKLIQFVVGIAIIILAPILANKVTSLYFGENGFIIEEFICMLKAFYASFMLVGGIICIPSILYWYKNYKH